MKRVLCLALMLVIATATPALAWTATASGSAECDRQTGEWIVTWTISHDEEETATVVESDRASVPVGSTIPPGSTDFTERLPGDSDSPSLAAKLTWPSHETPVEVSATAELEGSCDKPEPPPTPPADNPPPDDKVLRKVVERQPDVRQPDAAPLPFTGSDDVILALFLFALLLIVIGAWFVGNPPMDEEPEHPTEPRGEPESERAAWLDEELPMPAIDLSLLAQGRGPAGARSSGRRPRFWPRRRG